MTNTAPILEVHDLVKDFGGVRAVDHCSLRIKRGAITGILGPNGAGKTTLFNLVSGAMSPTSGQVIFDGRRIDKMGMHQTFGLGLVRTFQIPRELKRMTVLENLMLVPAPQTGEHIWASWLMPLKVAREERQIEVQAMEVLELLTLSHLADEYAGNLSGGQKKLLELARVLMAKPKMVLLDEPGAGVNRTLLQGISQNILLASVERDITFVIIEHDMRFVMAMCDPIIVMANGAVIAEGTPLQVTLLDACGVVAGYGETEILHGVSITVGMGEVVTIIGPNGCGKSTLLKAIVGLIRMRSGSIMFRGEDISGIQPDQAVRTGLSYVPQTGNVFPSLSIRENLDMGAFIRRDDYRGRIDEMFEIFPDLAMRPGRKAGTLSGGQRQMLALARALMLDPTLILLDEPSARLSPEMMGLVFERIRDINRSGVAVLLVEQNAREALRMSHRGYVLVAGENRLDDTGPDLLDNPQVASLYLGARPRNTVGECLGV